MGHLWSNVVWSTTEGPGLPSVQDAFLAESKVCNLDVAVRVEHDVVQLEVTVYDAPAVQVEQP